MSTSTVTRSIPTTSINDVSNLNTTTATAAVAPTTTTTPTELPATLLLPSVDLKAIVFSPVIKKDISSIPPAFFVGPHENENAVIFEPQLSSDSGSVIGYGDRRLSGILAETTEKPKEEKKEENTSEVPAKRIILDSSDATRGIFGDKRKKVTSNSNTTVAAFTVSSNNDNTTEQKSNGTVIALQESKTIRVFGYPSNLKHNVVQHFMTYGKIADSGESPGNWMTITYESSSAALAALKSNGIVISKTHMIGVSLERETTSAPITQNIIPMDVSNGVYKDLNIKKNGLGSGKVGVSAVDKYNADGEVFTNNGIISRLKDTFFGW